MSKCCKTPRILNRTCLRCDFKTKLSVRDQSIRIDSLFNGDDKLNVYKIVGYDGEEMILRDMHLKIDSSTQQTTLSEVGDYMLIGSGDKSSKLTIWLI